ncbi:MAG: hypothetical protein Q7R86_01090 [bacterium]|nr:hypothetical protein [bacterium]
MKKFKKFLPILILVLGLTVSFSVLAQTSEDEFEVKVTIKVTYPIAELGNCGNKAECRSFCDDPVNIDACVAFAQSRGLMNEAEANRATKFSASLKSGSTPGGCTTPEGCKTFCSNLANMEVCIDWAEENGLEDEHFNEAKKIKAYLESGGQMPGGCTSETTCKTYCEDFTNVEECFTFAEKVGLEMSDGPKGGPPSREAFELMRSGQTPGGCKSKNACDAYCSEDSHFEECITFAEKAGFMKKEEAEMVRKTGGKGPGGCKGRECENYCNNPAHQEECFKFAEEHGLIPPEELERAKEGLVRMKAGLENAPPEVQECLKTNMGTNIIEDIQSGKLTPGPQIGERMRECFERFGGSHNPQEVFNNMPAEVATCIEEKGIDIEAIKSGQAEFTPAMGDTIRVCFQSSQFSGPEGFGQGGPGMGGPSDFGGFLRSAPPEVASCLENALGSQFESLKAGDPPTDPSVGEKIRGCFNEFHSGQPGEGFGPNQGGMMGPGGQGGFSPQGNGGFSEPVLNCLRSQMSEEQLQLLQRGDRPSDEAEGLIRKCFTETGGMPGGDQGSGGSGGFPIGAGFQGNFSQSGGGFDPGRILGQFPGQVAECIKSNLSESDLTDESKIRAAAERCFPQSGTFPDGQFPSNQYPSGGQYPEGFTPPPEGSPGSYSEGQYPSGNYPPPPSGFESGSPPPPPPGSSVYRPSLLGIILGPFIQILN